MIGIYSGEKAIKQFAPEIYSFFPFGCFGDVGILIFHGAEGCGRERFFLERLLFDCIFVRGFHRQRSERIEFSSLKFDYLYDIFFGFPEQEVVSSFDLIVSPNEELRNDFRDVGMFIGNLKRHRLLMRYGRKVELKFPFLWDVFKNGFFARHSAGYLFERSNFILIPKIGVGGIGEFSMVYISSEGGGFSNLVKLLANEEKIDFSVIASEEGLPFY